MRKAFIFLFFMICSRSYAYHEFKNHCDSQEVLDYVKQFLPENPVILECGAFDGNDTIRLSANWPKGMVYSFEAIPSLFQITIDRTKHIPNVKVFQLALSDKVGKQKFYLSNFKNSGLPSGSSSILPAKDHIEHGPALTFNEEILVDGVTLDYWAKKEKISHIDFMWLDMQGFELNMIKASKLAKKAEVIYTEVEFIEAYEGQYLYTDVKKWMEEHGYKMVAIDFNEKAALKGKKGLDSHNPKKNFFGNAVFTSKRLLRKNKKMYKD